LAGYTESSVTAIATLGSHQSTFGGGDYDAFLVKFNSSGVRQWSTYYGGSGEDDSYSCATDASGNVYMTGETSSSVSAIATVGSHQSSYGGGSKDAFLVKFNSIGVRQWGTYYGSIGYDIGLSCATDATGNVYMLGGTSSTLTAISTISSHQSTFGGGGYDAFLVKFNESTSIGINEIITNSNSIYPIPNNGEFTIELNETTHVNITNVFGQVILNEKLMAGKQNIDVKNHANGIYFVQFIIDGKQQTIKLIKE
jgi:hypothetical protein